MCTRQAGLLNKHSKRWAVLPNSRAVVERAKIWLTALSGFKPAILFLGLGVDLVFRNAFSCARKYSWLCPPPRRSQVERRQDLGPRDGRSMWNLASVRGRYMPGAYHCHLIVLSFFGRLFISCCLAHSPKFVSHFSLNTWSDPTSFFCLFIQKNSLINC